MEIKNIENKEKPEYDTKSEKQNKFLKLIFEHKKITITLVVLLILSCTLITICNKYNQSCTPEISGVLPIQDYIPKNSIIEQYEGNWNGIEIKQLIRRVNSYNNNDIFPSKLNITYLSQPELTITSGDSYSYSWIKNSNYYNVSFEYDDFEGYITTIIIEDTTN